MMKTRKITFRSFLAAIVIVSLVTGSLSFAQEGDKKTGSLAKTSVWLPETHQILNINNLWTWTKYNGKSFSPGGDYSAFFPRGKTYILYSDGFVYGAKCYVDAAHTQPAPLGQLIRANGSVYGNGYNAGWVNGLGATAVREPLDNPLVRIYRVRRDWKEMTDEELLRDAAESNESRMEDTTPEQVQAVIDQYELSWNLWPVDHGAPFVDRNDNGVYDPPPAGFTVKELIENGYDEPGIAGSDPNSPADQVVFTIFNDLDASKTLFRSDPIGLEIQETLWGYNRSGPLGNIFFRKFRYINKGGVDIDGAGTMGAFHLDSMYVTQWADAVLGDYTDDCLGCDTTLNMAFEWNGNPIDNDFRKFNMPPGAAGFDFLQGPMVPSPGDRAVFNLKYVDDYKNLGLTSFSYFSAASAYSDPGGAYDTNTLRWYKMMRGYAPIGAADEDIRYNFPPGVEPNNFPLAGDPVTGIGHIDGMGTDYSIQPGDRRIVMSSGPFQMAPGDTNEVVVAFVAGLGADRFSSISVMKFNDRFAQNTYDALFQVATPPASPDVKIAELDGEILLEWASNLERVTDTETIISQPGNYKFEGYNLYQLPTANATLADAIRIVTFDLLTEPTVVLDEQFDLKSGSILPTAVQFGTNSGIQRNFTFNRDYIKDIEKIYNGVGYYVGVTAYSVSTIPGYLPKTLESGLQIKKVVPKVPFGTVYESVAGDTISVEHVGTSDGIVDPIVYDPTQLTGNSYQVTFSDTSGGTVANLWNLTNTTKGQVLLSDQTNLSGEGDYAFVEGLEVKVSGPPLEGKSWSATGGDRWFSGEGSGELLYGGAYLHPSWSGGTSGTAPPDFKTVEIRFVTKAAYTDTNGNGSYDIGEPYTMPAEGTQKAFMSTQRDENSWVGFNDVPFTVWDVHDPANPRQLNVVIRDRQGNGMWDLHSAGTEWNYMYITSTDYDPTGQIHLPTSEGGPGFFGTNSGHTAPVYWVLWLNQRGSREPYGADVVLTLVPNLVITTNDVYNFTSPAPVTSLDMQKTSAEKVGVFPNPYYAQNPLERDRLGRFVTFNNLPPKAKIRIFTVSGHLIRVIEKDDLTQFKQWDLLNQSGLPVASGIYIAYIDMPDIGVSKILKLVIVMEAEILDIF